MANFMFVLRPTKHVVKTVCPECAKRVEVIDTCPSCRGSAIKKHRIDGYYVQERPIEITYVDRDPENGVLRYWENSSEFFYETVVPSLNRYVPEVPYGIHLCHDNYLTASKECERINTYLTKTFIDKQKPREINSVTVHRIMDF